MATYSFMWVPVFFDPVSQEPWLGAETDALVTKRGPKAPWQVSPVWPQSRPSEATLGARKCVGILQRGGFLLVSLKPKEVASLWACF